MNVEVVMMNTTTSRFTHENVVNTGTTDGLYYIRLVDGTCHKYPVRNIYLIKETK